MRSESDSAEGADPVRILAEAARALREHYLQARAAVAEVELELAAARQGAQGTGGVSLEREGDLAELRTAMRGLRDRYEEMEREQQEAASALSAARLRLKVQELLRRASPGHEAEALDEARRTIAETAARAELETGGLDPETRLELEKIDRLARALRLAGVKP